MTDQESLLNLTELNNRQERCINIINIAICVILAISVGGFLLSLYL